MSDKPRVRVPAGSQFTADNFTNFAANLGYGTGNLTSASTYTLNPLTRDHYKLEMMYRGSWLARQIVDSVAEDMTRAGLQIESDMPPDDIDEMMQEWGRLQIWHGLRDAARWGRLYGGAVAVIMIDGQKLSEPLRVQAVSKGQFKGLLVFDRWMLQPQVAEVVRTLGPDYGLPRYYDVMPRTDIAPSERIHHSRCIRFEGVRLPFWQKIAENLWGLSVLEPMQDRMIAFDSATAGAAQLVYKAHLRTLSVERLRELIAAGGSAYQAFLGQINIIRQMQTNEGMTILDASDKFEAHQYMFGGLDSVLVQFGQQLSGAAQIPLVRLFGQSPAGMNATGESDIRNYYDMINAQQEAVLRRPVNTLLEVIHRSVFGTPLPDGFGFSFRSLWQMQDTEKAQIAAQLTQAILAAQEAGVLSQKTILQELRQQSKITGVWSNISDEDIKAADDALPDPSEAMAQQDPTQAGSEPPRALPSGESPDRPPGGAQGPGAEGDDVPRPSLVERITDILNPQRINGTETTYEKVKRLLSRDELPMVEVAGFPVVVETPKGTRRDGNGWSHVIPADYGYIQGTSSAEGAREQMDCYVGPNRASEKIWIIEQIDPDTGAFDEHKVMLGFDDRTDAMLTYKAGFNDGTGPARLGRITEMTAEGLRRFLGTWQYGQDGDTRQSHSA